ncbi:MAG: 2OG-Fe(II) oxygenase [Acidobacteriaceae bacterium]
MEEHDNIGVIEPIQFVKFDEFLAWPELSDLTNFVNDREDQLRPSSVIFHSRDDRKHASVEEYRRSHVTLDLGPFTHLISARIRFYFPQILRALKHPMFEITRLEPQITASNDGDFFKIHNDSTHAKAPSREITFVYFFHREPVPFTGGELVIYESRSKNGESWTTGKEKRITPEQNSIVFFPSLRLHEVLPVHCRSRQFADSRFTLNGWIHS